MELNTTELEVVSVEEANRHEYDAAHLLIFDRNPSFGPWGGSDFGD